MKNKREEFLNEFFEYLDSLSETEYDNNSLTGHGRDWVKNSSQIDVETLGSNKAKEEFCPKCKSKKIHETKRYWKCEKCLEVWVAK